MTMAEFKHIYVNELESKEKAEEKSVVQHILAILVSPGKHICMFFIPNVDEEELGKAWVPLMPAVSTIACIILTKSMDRHLTPRMGLLGRQLLYCLRLSSYRNICFPLSLQSSQKK